jgi:nucleotide-binding universal stress UspA family protein
MFNTILVPLDGSRRAETILPHVQDLARGYNAKVILLQVVEPTPLGSGLEQVCTELGDGAEWRTKQAKSYLAALREGFCEKGIEARTRIVHGPAVEAIIDAADRESADLIAMAGQDRTGWSQGFHGCVAASVLRHVDWPLLLIRSRGADPC